MIDLTEYPESIDFNFPGLDSPVVLQYDDDIKLFRQLVCWCLIQRFRYYVINEPLVTDTEYDHVEKFVLEMREEADYLRRMYCPLELIGSSRRQDYPVFIRLAFKEPVA